VPSPPPPPLSSVVPHWGPLYFFLALLGVYLLVMAAVLFSFRRRGSTGENQPLKGEAFHSSARQQARFGRAAWRDVDQGHMDALRQVDGYVRAAFIRKVYAILSTQLLVTVATVVGLIYGAFVQGDPMYMSSWGHWIVGPGRYMSIIFLLLALVSLCVLMSFKNSHPSNLIGLGTFTLLESLAIGVLCISYYERGYGDKILLAWIITTATFLGLTLFTIFSRIDFSFLGPLLCAGVFIFLIWGLIMSLAFTIGGFSAGWHLVFVILGVILFTGFIIYDTYMIVTRVGLDDYVIAAIELYLDIINLFLLVLALLTCSGGRD